MLFIKKNIVRTFVAIELIVYSLFYYYGYQGIQQIEQIKKATEAAEQRVAALQSEIVAYEDELEQWNVFFSFYKEKIAREQLQMARCDDIIYYMTK